MECAGATPPSDTLARRACALSMVVAFGRPRYSVQIGRACPSTALMHIPIAFSSDRISAMPIFRYFLYVGSLLSLLLFSWSIYLKPPTNTSQATPPPATLPEIFRPTAAAPIVEAEQVTVEGNPGPSTANGRSRHVAKVTPAKKKQRTRVAAHRRESPDRSFAYFPQTPFFFGWR
jgi:hypothetical protein